MAKLPADLFPDICAVLPDACGKYQVIKAAKLRVVGTDIADDAVAEYVDGELCPLISRDRGLFHIPQIVADAGNTQETAVLCQPFQHFIQTHAFFLKERNDKGVDIAAAVGLNDSHLKGNSEAGIHALSVVNGAQRAASAQMAGDGFSGAAVHFGQRLRHIAVGSPVVAQTLDSVFLIPFIGNAVDFALHRNCLVEGSLKGAYQHGVRRQLLKLADGLQIRFIVGGSHHHVIFHALEHIGSQFMDAVVALGKNGLEAYPLQLGQASQHAVFCVQNIVQKKLNAFRIGRDREIFLENTEAVRL